MHVKFPWPLWARKQIVTLYPKPDQANDETILLFSSQANEKLEEKYFTEEDKKNFVLMRTLIGCWILTPIKDESGTVTGTHMWFANASNTGGIVPEAIQN